MSPARIGREVCVIVNHSLFEVASRKVMGLQGLIDL